MKQDPIDFANEVISQGIAVPFKEGGHPALARVVKEVDNLYEGCVRARMAADRAKAIGMADTENHNFVNQHIVQQLKELSRVAANVAKNIEEKLKP